MKKLNTVTLKRIGYISLIILFSAISAIFLFILYESNEIFFKQTIYYTKETGLASDIFFYATAAITVILTILSFIMAKKKLCNKICLIGTIVLSLAGAVTYSIMSHVIGLWELSFSQINLYILYFFIVFLSNALPFYSAVRNLVKIRCSPITFAKADEK